MAGNPALPARKPGTPSSAACNRVLNTQGEDRAQAAWAWGTDAFRAGREAWSLPVWGNCFSIQGYWRDGVIQSLDFLTPRHPCYFDYNTKPVQLIRGQRAWLINPGPERWRRSLFLQPMRDELLGRKAPPGSCPHFSSAKVP